MASSKDLGILSIILAIVGFFIFGLLFGLLAVIVGIIGLTKKNDEVLCIIGIVLGILAILI